MRSFLLEQLVDVNASLLGLLLVGSRHTILHEPGEMVSHARLPRFVPEEARHDAVLDVAAHTGHDVFLGAHHHVAVGGAHDDHHARWLYDRGRRNRDVGIYVSNGHGGAWLQPGPSRRLFSQPASLGAQWVYVARHLLVDDVLQAWVQGLEELT